MQLMSQCRVLYGAMAICHLLAELPIFGISSKDRAVSENQFGAQILNHFVAQMLCVFAIGMFLIIIRSQTDDDIWQHEYEKRIHAVFTIMFCILDVAYFGMQIQYIDDELHDYAYYMSIYINPIFMISYTVYMFTMLKVKRMYDTL